MCVSPVLMHLASGPSERMEAQTKFGGKFGFEKKVRMHIQEAICTNCSSAMLAVHDIVCAVASRMPCVSTW